MEALPADWQKISKSKQKVYKQFLDRVNVRKTLPRLSDLHDKAFSKISCLDCAGCCKNYSPRFKTPDIKRISKYLNMRESEFIDKYLRLDSDGDYVANQAPCPFLGMDNRCSVYDVRPSDCARFPYTDEDVLLRRPQITLKNSEFCPAVFYVLENILLPL